VQICETGEQKQAVVIGRRRRRRRRRREGLPAIESLWNLDDGWLSFEHTATQSLS
jgi:hypothetical protein